MFSSCLIIFVRLESCFFFKPKTAYELLISDWSSDVCSSDLLMYLISTKQFQLFDLVREPKLLKRKLSSINNAALKSSIIRSEEHTSELQSLMRISYAVFCLKKKKKLKTIKNSTHTNYNYK